MYDYKEPLRIVGIREKQLELEGDYSGGTHNMKQSDWLPIEGVSKIYDYGRIKKLRDRIIVISKSIDFSETDLIQQLIEIGLELTKEVE